MDASEFKEYIFGVALLEAGQRRVRRGTSNGWWRTSSLGAAPRQRPSGAPRTVTSTGRRSSYRSGPGGRVWATSLHHQVGDGLNKALAALEEANESLEGVLQYIDFSRRVGNTTVSDKKWRDLIMHFSKYPLRNSDFEFPDLLGAGLRVPDPGLRGLRGQEGWRVLHAAPGGAAHGALSGPPRRVWPCMTRARARAAC